VASAAGSSAAGASAEGASAEVLPQALNAMTRNKLAADLERLTAL
jgi:hypothetical protein